MLLLSNFFVRIILVALFFRVVFLVTLPPGQYPDEIFIFDRVYASYAQKFFPERLINHTEYYPNNEYLLPPLYFEVNSYLLYIASKINGSKGLNFIQSFEKNIYVFRLESLIVSIATLFLYWKILEKLKLENNIKKISFLTLSLLPTVSAYSGGVSFHPYVFLLMAFAILTLINFSLNKRNILSYSFLGAIVGISVLVHFEGVIILALVIAYMFFTRKSFDFLRSLTVLLITSFVFGGWWYLFNIIQFGAIYNPKLVEANKAAGFIAPFSIPNYLGVMLRHTFETFFFTAGRTNNVRLDYLGNIVWKAGMLTVLVGLFLAFKQGLQKNLLKLPLTKAMIFSFVINILLFWQLNLIHNLAPQGRYFYPSILLISIIVGLGLVTFFKSKAKYLVLGTLVIFILMNMWSLNCVFIVYERFSILPTLMGCVNYPN